MSFEKGEMVKITDGPFTNFSGKIDEVNSERDTCLLYTSRCV